MIGVAQPNGTELGERPVCHAFPDGIPIDIAYGDDPHTTPRAGQVGSYVFTQSAEGEEP